mgnify:CR=1 FL=1
MTLNFEKKSFHIVVIDSGRVDYGLVLEKIVKNGMMGYSRFTIHVLSNHETPFHLEKLRSIIQNNIAYTLIIRYHKLTENNVKEVLTEVKNKPHEIIGNFKVK